MNPTLEPFAAIAREHLGIGTLELRHSESLDVHDVCVAGLKRALQAAYQAGRNASAHSDEAEGGVLREMREALVRAEFLMRRVYEGDHHALENLPSAAKQARAVLTRMKRRRSRSNGTEAALPIVTVEVRGGLIEDVDATIPLHAVVEDWDAPDWDTGKKPTRSVWKLTGGLAGPRVAKLRRLIAND